MVLPCGNMLGAGNSQVRRKYQSLNVLIDQGGHMYHVINYICAYIYINIITYIIIQNVCETNIEREKETVRIYVESPMRASPIRHRPHRPHRPRLLLPHASDCICAYTRARSPRQPWGMSIHSLAWGRDFIHGRKLFDLFWTWDGFVWFCKVQGWQTLILSFLMFKPRSKLHAIQTGKQNTTYSSEDLGHPASMTAPLFCQGLNHIHFFPIVQ